MKKQILLLTIMSFLFAGCGYEESNENTHKDEAHEHGNRMHEDGSVHEEHQDPEHHHEGVESDSSMMKTEMQHGHIN